MARPSQTSVRSEPKASPAGRPPNAGRVEGACQIGLFLFLCILFGCFGWQTRASATVLYQTGFEPSEGYNTNSDLLGQQGWVGVGSGGNGLTDGFFADSGEQAYIGFTAPNSADTSLFVYQPINRNVPQCHFSVTMSIWDSTTTNRDDFYWSVYNQQGQHLFSVNFANSDLGIYYYVGETNLATWSGLTFTNEAVYQLSIAMDFVNNRWSAMLGNAPITTNQPISTGGATLNLGDIDAVWIVDQANAPGDNFMVFDDYRVSATITPPQIQALGLLNGAPTLRINGYAGNSFAVESSTNLVQWLPLKTNVTVGGTFDFVDDTAVGHPRRFYRARWVP